MNTKLFRKTNILLLALTLVLSFVNASIFANETSLSIQERLNRPDINILDDFTITWIDNNGNPITGDPDINSRALIRINWSLFERDEDGVNIDEYETDLIEAGDFYTFTLPSAFRVASTISNVNLSGFGVATINTNNSVVFTFNENVSQNSEIQGFIEFTARLNSAELEGPGVKEVILPIREETVITFNLVPTNRDTGVNKLIHAVVASSNERNPSAITWEVQINKAYETLINAVVTDTLPASLELSVAADAIEVFPLFLNFDGTLKPLNERYGPALVEGTDYTVSGTTISFSNPINTPYAIRLKTIIKDSSKPALGGNLSITNQVSLSSQDLDPIPASATYVATYGRLLSKSRIGYTADTQIFTWRVAYNFGEITLVTPELVDTFSSNMTYVPGSLTIRSEANVSLVENVDFTVVFNDALNTLTIQYLNTINQAYNIEYRTTLRPEVIVSGGNISVSNTVTSEGQSSSASGTANPRVVVKSSNSINYATRQIGWQIAVNINRYEMTNLFLTDTYNSFGLEMVSLVVRNITLNTVVDPSQYTLVKTFVNGVESGFTLEFINDYATTDYRLRVDVVTAYDMNNKPTISGISRNRFRNTAVLNWDDLEGNSYTDTSSANRDVNTQTVLNGQKSGNYNAVTKQITWNIRVNYHNDDLVEPRLTDVIVGEQVFIPESLVIYEYNVNSNGTMTRVGGALDLDLFTIQYPTIDNGFTLIIDFPTDNARRFEVEFNTSLAEQLITTTYTNQAIMNNDGRVHPLDASVSVTFGNDLVTKSGIQSGSLIRWSIAINQSQSTIRDALLEDIPSTNQRFVLDSFKLYPTVIATNGTYTINRSQPLVLDVDYELTIIFLDNGAQRFELRFLDEITRPYVLEYDSEINTTPDNTTITNSVVLSGNGVTYEEQDDETAVVINIESAGGGAVGVQGSLQVRKENPDGEPLAGVVFRLINRFNRVIGEATTNTDGEVSFKNLVYGEYTLKEISTVGSYVISDTLFNGLSVTIDAASSEPNAFLTVTNRMNETTIKKVDIQGELLLGAVFTLEFFDEEWITVSDELSLDTGEVVIEGLSVGLYRLKEITAVPNYILNTKALEFEITRNDNLQAEDITVSFVNYQGSVRLVKENNDGERLEGVIFNLVDEERNIIEEDLVSNEEGLIEVTQLAPGNYAFIEIQSVNGNLINTNPVQFSIAASHEGEPEVVTVTALNGKANVVFNKINQNNEGLAQVRFALYEIIDDVRVLLNDAIYSDEEGLVSVEGLTPGNYEIVELETISGYILNTEVIAFNIPTSAQGENYTLELDDFINYRGIIIITKVNIRGTIIGEAVFDVLFNGEFLASFTTVNGVLELRDLAPGTYTFIETLAPEKYILDDTPYDVVIESSAEGEVAAIEFEFVNEGGDLLGDDDDDIPQTGDGTLPWLPLVLFLSGLFLVTKKEKYSR
ncbi:MAG: collagen binding domain-containing protein [Erysipelothrix sp.]|nr:collagen binding domain-containing protein [Erysipelothrix sp.]